VDKTTNTVAVWHKPVLVKEVLTYLDPQPGKTYLDVTFGSGGHSHAILEHEPNCNVIAMDWDAISLDTYAPLLQQKFGDRLQIIWGNFAHSYRLLKKFGITKVDGILADFGTSHMHIKERSGFSVYLDTPLDMRMSPAHQQLTAEHVINTSSQEKLQEIFWQLGEEKQARKIAQLIIQKRREKPIKTTRDLAIIVEKITPAQPHEEFIRQRECFKHCVCLSIKNSTTLTLFCPHHLCCLIQQDGSFVLVFIPLKIALSSNFLRSMKKRAIYVS